MELTETQFSQSELANLQESFSTFLETLTPTLIRATFVKTPFKAITISLVCPPKYPQDIVVIQLTSKTLDDSLLRKLRSVIEKELKSSFIGQPQCAAALRSIQRVVDQNMLLPCWQEINALRSNLRLASAADPSGSEKLELNEKSGTITLSLEEMEFFCRIRATVPNDYPCKVAELEILESNLPAWVCQTHLLLAQQHALKLVGQFISYEQHSASYRQAKSSELAPPPSTRDLLEHKEDMKLLKQLTDLTLEGSKDARRQKTRLIQSEIKKRPSQQQQHAMDRATAASITPSLTASMAQLILMLRQFPYRCCAGCEESIAKTADQPAERLVCGDYWHVSCLRKHMDTPPFSTTEKRCSACGNTLVHRWWTAEYARAAEKRHSNRERNQEEISSINDFLGL